MILKFYLNILFLIVQFYQLNCESLNLTLVDHSTYRNNSSNPANLTSLFKESNATIISIVPTDSSNHVNSTNKVSKYIRLLKNLNKNGRTKERLKNITFIIPRLDKELEELKQPNLDKQINLASNDNKLKRTKRRGGRIGGKSSSSGIGHGRTGKNR